MKQADDGATVAADEQMIEASVDGSGDGAHEESGLARLLDQVVVQPPPAEAAEVEAAPAPAPEGETDAPPALRTARIAAPPRGRRVAITWRGKRAPIEAEIDASVDIEVIARAATTGDAVLVEHVPGSAPVVVGVVTTRIPDVLEIKAGSIVIDAEREVLLRAGRGAMRLREDGDVEVVGSRILTMSRGLFRIVGRVLRLN